ncbi:MAG: septal ring lytic transglycosylase RlpA family protein [Sulfuriflexus sp.]|nr:septal ring lytic transglycosylase RlpA family protein [Sulfuriflexus sp.]
MPKPLFKTLPVFIFAGLLSACGGSAIIYENGDSAPSEHRDLSNVPDAIPKTEPRSRYGNPKSYVVRGKRYYVKDSNAGFTQRGIASWYGTKFHGRRTSSGEPYDMYAMTAAHKTLPLPTYLEVINLRNNKRVIVKANDRGPFHENRIIDLSYAAATRLGITASGTGLVEIRALNPAAPTPIQQVQTPAAVNTDNKTLAPNMYLQIGAFSSQQNAQGLSSKLHNAAFARTAITTASSNGNTIYRVRIGPLSTVDEADQLVDQLASLGINDTRVVID